MTKDVFLGLLKSFRGHFAFSLHPHYTEKKRKYGDSKKKTIQCSLLPQGDFIIYCYFFNFSNTEAAYFYSFSSNFYITAIDLSKIENSP